MEVKFGVSRDISGAPPWDRGGESLVDAEECHKLFLQTLGSSLFLINPLLAPCCFPIASGPLGYAAFEHGGSVMLSSEWLSVDLLAILSQELFPWPFEIVHVFVTQHHTIQSDRAFQGVFALAGSLNVARTLRMFSWFATIAHLFPCVVSAKHSASEAAEEL